MATIIAEFDLFKKPTPKKKQNVEIVIPKEQVDVSIAVALIDKRDKDFNRKEALQKIKKARISNISKIVPVKVVTTRVVMTPVETKEDVPSKRGPTTVRIRRSVKKPLKIKLGKNILKGTITAINLPAQPEQIPMSKSIRVSAKRRGKVKVRSRSDVPQSKIKIGDTLVVDRMWPNVPKINLRASSYYMNNRKIFINFINSLFEPYRQALEEERKNVSCDRGSGAFSLMTHQAIVRDYINLYSPYRGLLLYHGLGAGKTCASISIAEGVKTEKQIVVMTPASLRQNYMSELKMCGDPLYRLNQFWEFIETNGNVDLERKLSELLHLPEGFVATEGGAWLVNMKKEANYKTLTTPAKMKLNRQIDAMISAKYAFLNYNGLRSSHLPKLTGGDDTVNPFDNKVIIIDEAHNFVSRIVNKIKKKDSLSYKLYQYLMSATDCKIIFLTGTPIINYPNEIGIMFNMLRGYIKTFTFYVNVQSKQRVDQKSIERIFSSMMTHDYVKYNASSKTIVITRNPFGFVSTKGRNGNYEGVKRNRGGNKCDPKNRGRDCQRGFICGDRGYCIPMSDSVFVGKCMALLRSNDIEPMRNPKVDLFTALPDTLDEFNGLFINPKTGDIKNLNLFQKRILGLTSYFRSAQEQLMPAFDIENDLIIAEIPMSDYQFGLYETAREGERAMESKNAKRKKAQASSDGIYGDSVSTYRIFSRAFCNFVFPRAIPRPKPQEDQDLKTTIMQDGVDEDDLDAISLQERLKKDGIHNESDMNAVAELAKQTADPSYAARIDRALEALQVGASEYLSVKGLEIYSPKFKQILDTIMDVENIGLHLIYSQFRTLEGIGIFSLVLEQNGFARFTIKKSDAGIWKITIPEEDRGKPMFALYTGTEDSEEKEIIRNVFNGTWDKIPSTIREYVTSISSDNNHGEIIKIFMITSSGAEGITLKNTRYVHIMEPYWHPVRVEQVIGRARRICSHNELPESERNVKVYIYLMKFAEKQLVPAESGGIRDIRNLLRKDVSKIDRKTPLTSDQALWEISNIKEDINKQILMAVKSSSIDCSLHARATDKDPVVCMSFGVPTPDEFTMTPSYSTTISDKTEKQNKKKTVFKAEMVKLDGIRYALRRFNQRLPANKAPEGELYDYESYLRAVKTKVGQPTFIGYLRIDPATRQLKKTNK